MKRTDDKSLIVSSRIYALLLFAYPENFRREYGFSILALVVSFLIWFAVHWLWAQRRTQTQHAVQ